MICAACGFSAESHPRPDCPLSGKTYSEEDCVSVADSVAVYFAKLEAKGVRERDLLDPKASKLKKR